MKMYKLTAIAAMAACAGAAQAEAVTMTGGWVADFSPAMMETSQASTTVFQFEGSYKLVAGKRDAIYLLTTCVGMETATTGTNGETSTKGSGRCELKDRSGDKLLAAMETAFDGFALKIQGGTGKWAKASGKIVSKETFTVEGERQLKGYSNAQGELKLD